MKLTFILLFITTVSCYSCRQIKIPSYPSGESIEVVGSNYRGYIFDKDMTVPWMMAQKDFKFSAYWWLNECEIPTIEECLQEYVSKHLDVYVQEHLNSYLRQYFPFISKDGHQMIHITLSELRSNDPYRQEIIENIGIQYRSVFDGKEHAYHSILLNYSKCRDGDGM